VWSLEDIEMERETHELIKPDKSNSVVLEFPNINTPVVKTEDETSEILTMPEPFSRHLMRLC
jgi:hypothetical protein